ncbi:MAG TPA: ABC transporter permease [Acidimicrobiales bacterium]|nr:ABC transporter permease [Acidimicrobiales bacterium]
MSFWSGLWQFFSTGSNWSGQDGIFVRLGNQVELSLTVVAAATLVGMGLGFYLGHTRRGGFVAVNAANSARAVPSIALLTILAIQPFPGLRFGGFLTAGITLGALAIPPILTNSYVGMREVDPDVREAARAMGMGGWQRFWRVEVPLALPLAVAGVRTAAVEVVATSTLAAYVTFNDLGEYIFAGLAQNDTVQTFSGALLVALLAGGTDLVLFGLYRLVTPGALVRSGAVRPEQSRGIVRRFPALARSFESEAA